MNTPMLESEKIELSFISKVDDYLILKTNTDQIVVSNTLLSCNMNA